MATILLKRSSVGTSAYKCQNRYRAVQVEVVTHKLTAGNRSDQLPSLVGMEQRAATPLGQCFTACATAQQPDAAIAVGRRRLEDASSTKQKTPTRTAERKSLASLQSCTTFENTRIPPAKLAGQLRYAVPATQLCCNTRHSCPTKSSAYRHH